MKQTKDFQILFYRTKGYWIAQCVNYDIAAVGDSDEDAAYELQRLLIGRLAVAHHLRLDPFADVPPAPEEVVLRFKRAHEDEAFEEAFENATLSAEVPPAFVVAPKLRAAVRRCA